MPDNQTMKNQAKMFKNMTDDQLQMYINQMKTINPMMANVTPQQLRQTTERMEGMSDSEINMAKNMA